MGRLVLGIIFTIAVVLFVIEATVFGGLDQSSGAGDPGLVVRDGSVRLGQQHADLSQYSCWGMMEYTAACRFDLVHKEDVSVNLAIQENTIIMATYEADTLLNVYGLVQHWGQPLVVEKRERDIYLSWEHFVYGIITPNRPGAASGYTLTTWSEA